MKTRSQTKSEANDKTMKEASPAMVSKTVPKRRTKSKNMIVKSGKKESSKLETNSNSKTKSKSKSQKMKLDNKTTKSKTKSKNKTETKIKSKIKSKSKSKSKVRIKNQSESINLKMREMKEEIASKIESISQLGIENKNFECKECKQQFKKRQDISNHIARNHISHKPFKCNKCDESFALITLLNVHANLHLNKYKCEICNKQCPNDNRLEKHMIVHTKERAFECHECDLKFPRKPGLDEHIAIVHSSNKPYKCNKCKETFAMLKLLNRHKNKHSAKYQCKICKHKHISQAQLNIHMRNHTGEKPFTCQFCNEKFKTKHVLKCHHSYKHATSNEKIYKCDINNCQQSYTMKCLLNKHKKYSHKNE